MIKNSKIIGMFGAVFFTTIVLADVPQWQIVQKESSLSFTATQNNAPTIGKFNDFSGDIFFDPNQLKESHVHIVVDMTSVSTSYTEIADTLKSADWFNIASYPQAVFTASDFIKTGDKSYRANGKLMIRGKNEPIVMDFKLDEYTEKTAKVEGSVILKRLAFGIGQGEWQKTNNIKDEVKVSFVVNAIKK